MWLFNMNQFKSKDLAFVSKWLAKRQLTMLCNIFESVYENERVLIKYNKDL